MICTPVSIGQGRKAFGFPNAGPAMPEAHGRNRVWQTHFSRRVAIPRARCTMPLQPTYNASALPEGTTKTKACCLKVHGRNTHHLRCRARVLLNNIRCRQWHGYATYLLHTTHARETLPRRASAAPFDWCARRNNTRDWLGIYSTDHDGRCAPVQDFACPCFGDGVRVCAERPEYPHHARGSLLLQFAVVPAPTCGSVRAGAVAD